MATLAIWHGYLLGGTGSNIYSVNMAREWAAAGHDVVLMCQDADAERFEFVTAVELVSDGALVERMPLRAPAPGHGRCTCVRTDLHGLLPVYVLDRYAGFEVRRFPDLDQDQLDTYVQANRHGMEYVVEAHRPSGVMVNHAVMGPESLRPVLQAAGIPYVVKIHGSEIEYALVEDERYLEPARSGLRDAAAVLVGSAHIERRLVEVVGADCVAGRIRLVPPGVDTSLFAPAPGVDARMAHREALVSVLREAGSARDGHAPANTARLLEEVLAGGNDLVERLRGLHGTYEERSPDVEAADRIAALPVERDRPLLYVGKFIRQKGPQLVVAAFPLVLMADPHARLVMTGFGPLREGLQALVVALSRGRRDIFDQLVAYGDALDGGPHQQPFAYLPTFLDGLERQDLVDRYWSAARGMEDRVDFTGLLGHEHLAHLWPICDASVVPSIFPEAFGMVAAEAAACGALPVIAEHTGLADVVQPLRQAYPAWGEDCLAFDLERPDPVGQLASILTAIREAGPATDELRLAARRTVEELWSWRSIGERVAALVLEPAVPRHQELSSAICAYLAGESSREELSTWAAAELDAAEVVSTAADQAHMQLAGAVLSLCASDHLEEYRLKRALELVVVELGRQPDHAAALDCVVREVEAYLT